MVCDTCGDKPKNESKHFPKAVVEINNPESLVLLRKVVVPASMGDDTEFPPRVGKYYNVLLHYDANGRNYIYSSDGIPTVLDAVIPPEIYERIGTLETGLAQEILDRQNGDTALGTRITNLDNSLATVAKTGSYTDLLNTPTIDSSLSKTSTNTVQNSAVSTALDNSVMTGLSVSVNTSTTTVQLDGAKKNLYSGSTTTDNIPLPVASTTQAGVMNSSTYDAVTSNTNNLNAIMNGAVAITGISASPSQSDLTTAWQTETGLTTLINRASIYDVSNDKVWTYYTNDTVWHAASNTSQVTINTFTNSSEGTIKGSTNVGQIFAENDGTGSVNGWDALSGAVATNTSDIATLQGSIPTVNNATLTIQQNGTNVATFTANSATNTTANMTVPVITMTMTDPGEGAPLAENNFVAVYGGDPIIMDYSTIEINTGAKWIDGSTIYKKTINFGTLPNATEKTVAHGISNLGRVIKVEGYAYNNDVFFPLPFPWTNASSSVGILIGATTINLGTGLDRTGFTESYITLYYTKSS